MHIGPLRQSDEVTVREWAVEYLKAYLGHYADAFGHDLQDGLEEHIEQHDLDSVLWHDVVHADYADSEFVGTMREGNAPLGMILATSRFDPYLRIPTGLIKWVYVSPKHRGKGIAAKLVNAAREWMANQGLSAVETTVAANNEEAVGLYEGAGLSGVEIRLANKL